MKREKQLFTEQFMKVEEDELYEISGGDSDGKEPTKYTPWENVFEIITNWLKGN
ncbi:MAG: hypothetical protein K6G30_13580 [Acetatifactor sp.]|jgi:hypothetical protein|nr:hypothetical protein [Acetatifactor sp.]